jgi:hypothetical protein
VRISEFYESNLKGIRGRYFTYEQYADIYAKKYGNFDYFQQWCGFNVPSNVLLKFIDKFYISPPSDNAGPWNKERELLGVMGVINPQLQPYLDKSINRYIIKPSIDKFYMIGTYKDDTFHSISHRHELAHAMFGVDSEYKANVMAAYGKWKDGKSRRMIHRAIKNLGYHDAVSIDEINAYCATETKTMLVASLGMDKSFIRPRIFKNLLDKYMKTNYTINVTYKINDSTITEI